MTDDKLFALMRPRDGAFLDDDGFPVFNVCEAKFYNSFGEASKASQNYEPEWTVEQVA